MNKSVQRKKKKVNACANPLFEKWLKEWKDSATESGLKTRFIYGKALTSLRRYPLPLKNGKEAKILEYFGDKICSMLDEKLCEWKNSQADPIVCETAPSRTSASNSSSSNGSSSNSQPLSVRPVAKEISERVVKNAAANVRRDISRVQKALPVSNHIEDDSEDIFLEDSFSLIPGSFDVILCVDNCETLSGHGKTKKQIISELQKSGIQFDIRKLNVGDFLWIARESDGQQRELVLNFIIERKRLDDLSHSIRDGRFREQKFRLRNCGLKHPIYLVEYHSSVKHSGIPEATLQQAIVNTQIVDNFLVKETKDIKESIAYLSLMTKYLKNTYQAQTLKSGSRKMVQKVDCPSNTFMDFREFNSTSVKNKCLTVKEMFAKHLLQFFGLSVDRAAAIVEQFQTPSKLFEAFDDCSTDAERIQLLAKMRYGKSFKTLGQAVSKSVHTFYGTHGALT